MVIWTLAKKDLRIFLRDPRAAAVLLVMPFLLILVLGLLLGEGFGQPPDERLRISVVNLDKGYADPVQFREGMAWLMAMPPAPGAVPIHAVTGLAFRQGSQALERDTAPYGEAMAWFVAAPGPAPMTGAVDGRLVGALALAEANRRGRVPNEPWSQVVLDDLSHTAGIRVELIESEEVARQLIRQRKRSAILVLGPSFSDRVARCSFLADGINPFYRDGIELGPEDPNKPSGLLDTRMLRDDTQKAAAAISEQVVQVSLLRVILPWMIGRAFEKIGQREFIDNLGERVEVPLPVGAPMRLNSLLTTNAQKESVGQGVQKALQDLYPKYNLTAKTWASLTKSEPHQGEGAERSRYKNEGGIGVLKRGAALYQYLVPMAAVAFAFFLVLNVGWLFTAERREGTLRRLRAAPVSRTEILLGKLLPCYAISVAQGLLLLGAGKLIWGLSWGPDPLWLLPLVLCTSLAAMGLALFVASVAHTETQVAIYGTILVLGLSLIGGCLIPRNLMPEGVQVYAYLTPHAWALDAYTELLIADVPRLETVERACGVLAAFGAGFVVLAWGCLRLE
jgi:ABC-type transport system involved in multi-copper enzyme maturation permease subunit